MSQIVASELRMGHFWRVDKASLNPILSHQSVLKDHRLNSISGQKGAPVFYLWAAKRLLQGIPPLAWRWSLLADVRKQGGTQTTREERVRKRAAGNERTKVRGEEDKERWKGGWEEELREEGHEVRWKRSCSAAGEYSSLLRSREGLTQPLNTRRVSRFATHTSTHRHTSLPKDHSLCLCCSLPRSHMNCRLHTVICIIPQFAITHQNDDCKCFLLLSAANVH